MQKKRSAQAFIWWPLYPEFKSSPASSLSRDVSFKAKKVISIVGGGNKFMRASVYQIRKGLYHLWVGVLMCSSKNLGFSESSNYVLLLNLLWKECKPIFRVYQQCKGFSRSVIPPPFLFQTDYHLSIHEQKTRFYTIYGGKNGFYLCMYLHMHFWTV